MKTLLNTHTHFSLLEAIWKPAALLEKCHELGYTTVALTDYNWLYWAVEFYKLAKQFDIKPLLWVELGFVQSLDLLNERQTPSGTITLIATSNEWYQRLLVAVSDANMSGLRGWAPTIDLEWLRKLEWSCAGLVWLPQSRLWRAIKANESEDKLIELTRLCAEALWKEWAAGELYCVVAWRDHTESRTLKMINHGVVAVAKQAWLRVTISSNNHYINSQDRKPYEIALSIKDWTRVFDETRRRVRVDQALFDQDTMKKNLINQWFEAEHVDIRLETTNTITTSRATEIDLDTILFPTYVSPKEITELYNAKKDTWVVN